MRFIIALILSLFCCSSLYAQTNNEITITINPLLNKHQLILEKESLEEITVTQLKFYLTNFSLSNKGKTVWKEKNSYHLIDAANPSTLNIKLTLPEDTKFDNIHFLLGTDSTTNVAGVIGGDLDPTKGMYWAWNSGYINFKLEGKKSQNSFEFHLGGYSIPTAQKLSFNISKNNTIICFDIANFLNQLDLTKQQKLMSPGKDAQELSKVIASLFYIYE